jgi:hypothetical protein
MYRFMRIGTVLKQGLFMLTVGITTSVAAGSPPQRGFAQGLDDVIEHVALTEGAETLGGASVEDAVHLLRERTRFPINLEMIEFERPRDFVTLGEALAKLRELEISGVLSSNDKFRLIRYEELLKTKNESEVLLPRQKTFTFVQERITVREFLDRLMTLDDEYAWKNYGNDRMPLIVIAPRRVSALDWKVVPICHPKPIAYSKLFAGCNRQECGPFTKQLGDHNMTEMFMSNWRPTASVNMCRGHLTARDVLDLTVNGARASWTLAGMKEMRVISYEPIRR